ncbi:MAG: hypothetical protein NZ735_07290 [Candidatus Marinimicrobia bacterium]|nr:hypothetical protein [Candidatus Neomarinimicrobiota bacterium]
MEKLLTFKQQMEAADDPDMHELRKGWSRYPGSGEEIISDIENGVQITEDNIDFWNGIRLRDKRNNKRYIIGDLVSAWDYIKEPYDIFYVLDSDGKYKGAIINVTYSHPSIHIDTVFGTVTYTGFGFSQCYPYSHSCMDLHKALEEYWKSNQTNI